jgi:hypothetical protein
VNRIFFAPGDWIAEHTNARMRRGVIFWALVLIVLAAFGTYPARESVAVLWLLSVGALVLACVVALFAETPVETEE